MQAGVTNVHFCGPPKHKGALFRLLVVTMQAGAGGGGGGGRMETYDGPAWRLISTLCGESDNLIKSCVDLSRPAQNCSFVKHYQTTGKDVKWGSWSLV